MKRPWLPTMVGVLGISALVLSPLGMAASASPPHSDQNITVTKTAAGTGAPLAGAVFTLYKWHGSIDMSSPVAMATTDSSGQAVFSLQGHHNYGVVETTPPSGYTLPTPDSQVVKISGSGNSKGNDDPANVKGSSSSLSFVDSPVQQSVTTPPSVTSPPSAGSSVTSPATAAAGSSVPTATTVHTGMPFAGSLPYVVGTAAMGSLMVGTGLFRRRRFGTRH
jgi:uncharacterized surface anchored protein